MTLPGNESVGSYDVFLKDTSFYNIGVFCPNAFAIIFKDLTAARTDLSKREHVKTRYFLKVGQKCKYGQAISGIPKAKNV